jgi:DNA-binding GntR family transcriptional regulator
MSTADDRAGTGPPAYLQIAALLRSKIADGTLAPGGQVPSLTTLARQHGHHRSTCAKAVQQLEREHLLVRVPGRGYYVRDPDPAPPAPGSHLRSST